MIYHLKYFTSGPYLPIKIRDVLKKCMNCKWKRRALFTLWAVVWGYFSFTVWLCVSAAYPGMAWVLPREQEMISGCRSGMWGLVKSSFGAAGMGIFPRDIPIPRGSLFEPHRKSTVSCERICSEPFEHWNSLMKIQLVELFSHQSCAIFIPDHSVLCWQPADSCLFHRAAVP